MSGQTEVVRCRYVTGVLREITLEDLNEFVSPGSALQQRLVRVNDRVYVRKFVSRAAGSRNPRLYDLLDNEIRAGTRLGQVFPERFPLELASLVAYNIDVEEPFVLLREYSGVPLAGAVGRFQDAEYKQFERGLVRALRLTSEAGVVHGAVTADAMRWHGGLLQLVDFESAERVGEPRRGGGGSATRSPEQVAGTGVVDARDDVWAAGVLIRRLHLGAAADGPSADRRHDPDRLRGLLGPVFDNPVERRPSPAELLSRLHGDNHLPAFVDPDAVFVPGRELFEHVGRGKGGSVPVTTAPDRSSPPEKRPKRFFPFLAGMFLVAMMIIGAVVLL